MHPEIEKFWNKRGYKIIHDFTLGCDLEGKYSQCIWSFIDKNGYEILSLRGRSDLKLLEFDLDGKPIEPKEIPPCTTYIFEGKDYFEKDMLKIVRLTAFI